MTKPQEAMLKRIKKAGGKTTFQSLCRGKIPGPVSRCLDGLVKGGHIRWEGERLGTCRIV